MNSPEIESFLAIIEKENFTEAAKSLFISQSTLSHRLFSLEKELGLRLFERQKGCKNIILTKAGREFVTVAKKWQFVMQDIERIKLSMKSNLYLSVGTVDTFNSFLFPPLYQLLLNHTPTINLDLRTCNSAELYQQIERGELDVAFTLLNLPMKNILSEQVYKEPRVILRREEQPSKKHSVISLEELDLSKERLFIGDATFNSWYQAWKGKYGHANIMVDTVQLLNLFMQQEGCWTVVPLCIARAWAQKGKFAWYYPESLPPERVCYRIQSQYLSSEKAEVIAIFDKYLAEVHSDIFK